MKECPLYREFISRLPPVPYRELVKPKPYLVNCGRGRVRYTTEAETAMIDFDKRHAKSQVISKTYKPVVRW